MITINGKVYNGNSVRISGNKVYIDGKLQDDGNSKTINVTVNADIKSIEIDTCDSFQMK